MAAVIVEDGTGLTNSDSYVTVAELIAYAGNRGVTLTGVAEVALHLAMDALEGREYIGDKEDEFQSLLWPRDNIFIDGFYVPPSAIPKLLKEAQMEFAISIDAGDNPMANEGRETVREKIDVLEFEYSSSARNSTYFKAAESKLRKLLKPLSVTRA